MCKIFSYCKKIPAFNRYTCWLAIGMYILFVFCYSALFLLAPVVSVHAQQTSGVQVVTKDTSAGGMIVFDFSRDIQDQLPPLDTLMIVARDFSPMLDKYQSFSEAQKEKIELARKSWSTNIQLQGNYAIGNQNLILSGSAGGDLNQLSNGYRMGVNLGLPLFEFFSRHNRIKLAKAEHKASEEQLHEAGLLVDKEVATAYYQLLASFKQMKVAFEFAEKSAISEMIASKKLEENQIPIADYTRISEIRAGSEGRKFEAEKNFYTAFFTMQIILGVPLSSLIR